MSDILKLMYKFPAHNDRSADLSWKSATEKLDRLRSTMGVDVLKNLL